MDFQDFFSFLFGVKNSISTFHNTKKNKVHSFESILAVALLYFKLKYL